MSVIPAEIRPAVFTNAQAIWRVQPVFEGTAETGPIVNGLTIAICNDHLVGFDYWLSAGGPNARVAISEEHYDDESGESKTVVLAMPALHLAAAFGRAEMCRRLIAAGANPHIVEPCGQTAVSRAAICGDLKTLQVLAAAGVDLDARDALGRSALSESLRLGQRLTASWLIEQGAGLDVDITFPNGTTSGLGHIIGHQLLSATWETRAQLAELYGMLAMRDCDMFALEQRLPDDKLVTQTRPTITIATESILYEVLRRLPAESGLREDLLLQVVNDGARVSNVERSAGFLTSAMLLCPNLDKDYIPDVDSLAYTIASVLDGSAPVDTPFHYQRDGKDMAVDLLSMLVCPSSKAGDLFVPEVIEHLLEMGCKPNLMDLAQYQHLTPRLLDAMLAHGAELNQWDEAGRSVLHRAMRNDNRGFANAKLGVAELLHAAGARLAPAERLHDLAPEIEAKLIELNLQDIAAPATPRAAKARL